MSKIYSKIQLSKLIDANKLKKSTKGAIMDTLRQKYSSSSNIKKALVGMIGGKNRTQRQAVYKSLGKSGLKYDDKRSIETMLGGEKKLTEKDLIKQIGSLNYNQASKVLKHLSSEKRRIVLHKAGIKREVANSAIQRDYSGAESSGIGLEAKKSSLNIGVQQPKYANDAKVGFAANSIKSKPSTLSAPPTTSGGNGGIRPMGL